MLRDNDRGRPGEKAASSVSNGDQASVATGWAARLHPSLLCGSPCEGTQTCPDHGCPQCFTRHDGAGWCSTCDGIVQSLYEQAWPETVVAEPLRVAFGPKPAGAGHAGEDCLHCETCGLCCASGKVCRDCGLCVEHADDYGPCWAGNVWNRARRIEVPFARHTFYDLVTGRWGR